MVKVAKYNKIFDDSYPYCYTYSFVIHKEIKKWLKENKISNCLYLDGDDAWNYTDSYDTVSFKSEEDAMAFVLRFT